MKKNRILFITLTLLTFSPSIQAGSEGELLFASKCAACHSTTRPKDMSKVIAPALMGVMRHLKMDYPNKAEAVAFIKDFTLNPTKEKAICMPQKIERFGLMPSQKGNVNEKELEVIASWMFDNFPPKDFRGMGQGNRKGKGQRQRGVQPTQNTPFLIASLPHITKTVQKNWDNSELDLSDKQKAKLLKVRQGTMKEVRAIQPQIKTLVEKIKALTDNNEKVEKIMPLVQEVATLKAHATEVQLICLAKTKEILSAKQLEFLAKK
ncbi:cytochrome c [Sulfurovum sp. bin170]|uniref:c-type cytochrome n=1 Tax=Sulfurovum sp. bin170 TaxID=2695268 RepID=UPI0013DFB6CF|nr:c-type cytochrome [Sulfurovum sp. bin170]NEW61275.1 cytochrome c [Sulfurovum sp. bin170]